MNDKVCENCKWCFKNDIQNFCARYPQWLKLRKIEEHYCGEWKDNNDD